MIVLGLAALITAQIFFGWRITLGFALGATVAYLNFYWLEKVVAGRLNKQIAADLCISIKTVEKHRQQVMNKLNIHDVAGLTRSAISKGMVERTVPAGV